MKKDLLLGLVVLLILAAFLLTTDFQTVDQFYLTHMEDITPDSDTVTVAIVCGEAVKNPGRLDETLLERLPEDGVILPETTYVLRPGDTVLDLLIRTTRYNRIPLEYQGAGANVLGTAYVQGIGYLYEFSCGTGSGWVYSVNGVFPGCGCSEYALSPGDRVVWQYTCDFGRDVGALQEGGGS